SHPWRAWCALRPAPSAAAGCRRDRREMAICFASSPYLSGDFHDHPELCPLLLLGKDIAFLAGGEAALRRQAKLVERHEFGGLVDPPLDLVLALELAALGGDEAEHDELALGHEAQRLEAAGALGVELHEIAVHVDRVEQELRH